MKRLSMRAISFILCGILVISMVACGKDAEEGISTASEVSETLPEETSTVDESSAPVEEQDKDREDQQKQEEEAQKKAAEEEAQKKAEEEAQKKAAEEEARKKAAEEEAQKKAAEEEAQKKAAKEKNSFSMMYYLAITAEDIRIAKDNRLVLDDIYTSLLNDINPGAIDEITQDHLKNLRDIIKKYRSISTKRERLQYIYNQNKAAAMRSAVPNPLAILSTTQSLDWKKLALNAVYTVVDSYTNYKNASEAADTEFLMSGWDLDDEEHENIQKNRERAFDYMVDMVQEYNLDGLKTLSEKDIANFSEICAIDSSAEKIKRLKAEEQKYELLGNYWFELANCYFDTSQYKQCLECVEKYKDLSSGIYRTDNNIVQLMPKAIVAAQDTYSGDKYVSVIDGYAKTILNNTTSEDWSTRYFVAQSYIDLYSKTNKQQYLKDAYKIVSENVTVLLKGQRTINDTYINDVKEEVAIDPETTESYKFLTKEQQKEKDKEYSAEKKRVKEYNKALYETRKTELISLYEPLILNCELMFALSDKVSVSQAEKNQMDDILHNNVFLVDPIMDAYSFNKADANYNVEISTDEIVIPASLLTFGSIIEVTATDGSTTKTFDDCKVDSVKREGKTIDTFKAHITGKQWKKYSWSANSHITIKITYSDAYDKQLILKYEVSNYEEHWYGDKIEFTKE